MNMTSNDGDTLAGTLGDDSLSSTHNNTTLVGLAGADTLSSSLGYVTLISGGDGLVRLDQFGGDGDDDMFTEFLGTSAFINTLYSDQNMFGGAGDDKLHAVFAPQSSIYSGAVIANMTLDAGDGDDTVHATFGSAEYSSSWEGIIKTSGGNGND